MSQPAVVCDAFAGSKTYNVRFRRETEKHHETAKYHEKTIGAIARRGPEGCPDAQLLKRSNSSNCQW
jgi:hypothetical protein